MSGCRYIRGYLSESCGDTHFGDFPEMEVIRRARGRRTTSPISCVPLDLDHRCPPTFDQAGVRHTVSHASSYHDHTFNPFYERVRPVVVNEWTRDHATVIISGHAIASLPLSLGLGQPYV